MAPFTFRFSSVLSLGLTVGLGGLIACSSDEPPPPAPACSLEAQTGCAAGQACEAMEGGQTGCFAPLYVEGRVVKAADPTVGVANARIAARDVNNELASREIATSGADGKYRIQFPAQRKADGTPTVVAFALRADAAGYATFPSGLRVALPIDVTAPQKEGDGYVIKNATTDVALDALPDTANLGSLSGTVKATAPGGTLVVAGGATGLAAPDGTFTVFNVPAGPQEVRGYKQGLALKAAQATVAAGAEAKGVELLADTIALGSVKGDVSFVNAGGASTTTVVLVVKSTFNTALQRGETPRGLRAANVKGPWEIKDVPPGEYVVLAAFENDGLVRDPDTSIGGTALQTINVATGATAGSFKITGALNVLRPGAAGPETVTGTPTFEWADDSSEDGYHVIVYDTFGKTVWENKDLARVTGGNVSVPYAGPALKPGYYQFRAFSWRDKNGGRTYISASEDLKGIFIVK